VITLTQFNLICDDGHAEETLTVMAADDNEAMEKMLMEVHKHHAKSHPEVTGEDDEANKAYIMGHWTKGAMGAMA